MVACLVTLHISAQTKPDSTQHQKDSSHRSDTSSTKKGNNYDNQDKLYPQQWKKYEPLQKDDRDPNRNPDMMRDSLNRPKK